MPLVQSYAQGAFCWCEAATTDQNAAKEFYTKSFGWTNTDSEYAPGEYYTMLYKDGKSVAGMNGLDTAQRSAGVPSHWNIYVSVDNVDAMTTKAAELGATILAPAFDVMTIGRMSIIKDPTDAIIFLWQKGDHFGAECNDEPGAFCWYELATKNVNAAKTFYCSLFGWTATDSDVYTEFQQNGVSIAGMMAIPDVPPNWMPYIMVADLDASLATAQANQGTLLIGPGNAGEYGRFCVILDPSGAAFGLYQRTK